MRRAIRASRWPATYLLVIALGVYAASFVWSFSRISLSGATVVLDRGIVRARWLRTDAPWASSVPTPGWHVQGGPQGLRFRGYPGKMYGPSSADIRAEFALVPLTLAAITLHLFCRRHPRGCCRRCGYNLTGLPQRALCPECGPSNGAAMLLVAISTRRRAAPSACGPVAL